MKYLRGFGSVIGKRVEGYAIRDLVRLTGMFMSEGLR